MKLRYIPIALALAACTAQDAKTATQDALSAAQLACIFSTTLTDSKAVADACQIEGALAPIVSQLLEERDAARSAGKMWNQPYDAGAYEAARKANCTIYTVDAGAPKGPGK
jgi:hypothetical protein